MITDTSVGSAASTLRPDHLGVTEAELRETLESGKSLEQVACDRGKSVDGLVDALVDAAKERLDAAVAAGRITRAQADEMLDGLRSRIGDRVQTPGRGRPQFRPESGFRDFERSSA